MTQLSLFEVICMAIGMIVIVGAGVVFLFASVAAILTLFIDIDLEDDDTPLYDWDNEKLTFKQDNENGND